VPGVAIPDTGQVAEQAMVGEIELGIIQTLTLNYPKVTVWNRIATDESAGFTTVSPA
jgi:hypothetical protein